MAERERDGAVTAPCGPASDDPAVSVEAFAERVLGRPLWPHQVEAARSGRFVTTVAAARRTWLPRCLSRTRRVAVRCWPRLASP